MFFFPLFSGNTLVKPQQQVLWSRVPLTVSLHGLVCLRKLILYLSLSDQEPGPHRHQSIWLLLQGLTEIWPQSTGSLRTSAVSPRHSIQRTWHLSRLLTLPHPENHHWAEKKINLKFSRKKDLSFYHFQATLQEIWSPACQPRPCFSTTTSFHLCGYI